MVAGGVDEDAAVIPCPGLDAGIFVYGAQGVQLSIAQRDGVTRQQCDMRHIRSPYSITTLVHLHLC